MLYIYFSSYCVMDVKVAKIQSLLFKWYMLLSSCPCSCVRVCFVCLVACDYINIGLLAVQLLKLTSSSSSSSSSYYYYYY
jgi:hypothetical protein